MKTANQATKHENDSLTNEFHNFLSSPRIAEVIVEMDLDSAVTSLDELFQGWLSSPRCGDDLTSQKERGEIGFYYRKIRELLSRCAD